MERLRAFRFTGDIRAVPEGTPVFIGTAIILAAVGFVGYRMWANDCGAPVALGLGVLTVIPVVDLVLMYLALASQN